MLGLIEADAIMPEGDADGLIDADGDKDADGERDALDEDDGLIDADGDRDADGLRDADGEIDGLADRDGLREAEGETDGLAEVEVDDNSPPIFRNSVSSCLNAASSCLKNTSGGLAEVLTEGEIEALADRDGDLDVEGEIDADWVQKLTDSPKTTG